MSDRHEIVLERERRYQKLIDIGISLTVEHNLDRLMEMILVEAKQMCNADGGTLYIVDEDARLDFTIMRNDSLNIYKGGTTGDVIQLPPVQLFNPEDGTPNHKNVASYSALNKKTINIPDAYEAEGFDFSGTRKFDEATGYRSTSFLTVPLRNNLDRVIGVLQLINAQDPVTKEVIPFDNHLQPIIEALASQAAVALDNQMLLAAQRALMESFIELMAGAIDAKSPYTGGHCQRVPELTEMLADAACRSEDPRFRDFDLSDEEKYELHIASWLHDCGKVTTPEYVVDKATKLETIYDRIHEIRMRFEVVKREAEINYYKALMAGEGDPETLKADLDARLAQLDDDYAFIAECNIGGEFMAPERMERVERIAQETWTRTLDERSGIGHDELKRHERVPAKPLPYQENLLSDKSWHLHERDDNRSGKEFEKFGFKMDIPEYKYNKGEVYNLKIARGTLTEEERFKINDHIIQTIIMLEQLPFPRNLRRVPEYAGGHHEKIDGTGYPRMLDKDKMSLPARMMAVADIFEALTAADRPYKKAKKLSEAIKIMSFMKKDNHIDGDIFELFLTTGVYQQYADRFLLPEQIDEVDITRYVSKAAE